MVSFDDCAWYWRRRRSRPTRASEVTPIESDIVTPLIPILRAAFKSWLRGDLLNALETSGIPAGPINSVRELFADIQFAARRLRFDLAAPGIAGGTVPTVRTPIQFSEAALSISRVSPRLGEHTEEVKRELCERQAP